MSSFINQTISIFPNNQTSMHGIFAFLKEINNVYGSRYEISAAINNTANKITLDKYGDPSFSQIYKSQYNFF